MPPKKVLFLINSLGTGGTERNVVMFCRHLDRTRYLPEVWILNDSGTSEEAVRESGIVVRNLGRRWARSPTFAIRTAWQIARAKFDLIHAFLPTIASYAVLGRYLFGFQPPFYLSIPTTKFPSVVMEKLISRYFTGSVDQVLVNSPSVGQYAGELGFDPQRTHLVPNGHYLSAYQQPFNREAIRAEFRIGTRDKFLLCVGRLIQTKRLNDLVEALQIVRQRYTQWRLVIIGDGPMLEQVQDQIAAAGLSDEIFLLGRGRDLIPILRSADLFVFPSEVEGLPNAVIEAGLAGLPIVACDAPGVKDVIEHGKTGLLVETRNPPALAAAILELLEHPDRAQRLAAQAQQQMSAQYSTEAALESLYRAYDLGLGLSSASKTAAAASDN
jgi:glycosyltransferase involved in cell wall biosynthesis